MSYCFTGSGTLSVAKDGRIILGNITAWARPDTVGRTYPCSLVFTDPTTGVFEDKAHGVTVTLRIEDRGDFFVLRSDADYLPRGLDGERYGNHLDPECAYGFNFGSVPEAVRYAANYLKCEFWCQTAFADTPAGLPDRIQSLVYEKADGMFSCLCPVCDNVFKSNLRGEKDGSLTLYLRSNDYRNHVKNTVSLVVGEGKSVPETVADVTEKAMRVMGKKGKLRTERRYPEILEYLGWCSWDAFHMDVTHGDLLAKAAEFREKDIPVRWFIIDDMWGDVPAIDRKTMHSRELNDFEADPVRFPAGLKACITDLKEKYGIKTGMWHPTTGYWNGVSADGKLYREHRDLFVRTPNGKFVHSPELLPAFEYYNLQHSFYKDCGAEFVKVDNQGFINLHYRGMTSFGEAATNLHTAVEASVGANFDGAMINCMCMPSENFWNRPTSSVCRFSGDFQPEDRKWFVRHILQCSFNSVFQGCVYYGDWDMWWSDDAQAKKNAVLRAMSGGPVYVSDELNRSIKETINPIVLSDGRLLRLDAPATPAPDCMMSDAETNGKIFKVVNRIGDCGVLAAFDLDRDEKPVKGEVSPADMLLPEGEYVVYDWFAGKILKSCHPLTLKNYDDFRLYLFLPVKDGKAFIGLKDKYIAPKTLEHVCGETYRVVEKGTLRMYSKNRLSYVLVDGKKVPVKKVGTCLYDVETESDNATVAF